MFVSTFEVTMEQLGEILRLMAAALDYLTVRRDPITAKAYYTMAQDLLEELAKDLVSPAGVLVRKSRPVIRARLMHEKSLKSVFEIALSFWTQTIGQA
jgi:hypothetical protein